MERNDVRIYELKRMDLKGATIIDGFPSVGLVSSIAANYLIKVLDMEHIGIMDSVHFPTVSLIRDAKPLSPVRIYAGRKSPAGDQIVAFISEFQAPPNLIRPIAYTMVDWAIEQRCKMIVSPEGLVVDPELRDSADITDIVFGIASTQRGRELLKQHGIQSFEEGVISGVAGVLLNEGRKRDFDVITLLAEAHPDFPDARAAALVLEAIDRILLGIEFDAKPRADAVLQEKLKSLPNTTIIVSARTTEVHGDGDKVVGLSYEDRTTGEQHRLNLEGIFVQIGLVPNTEWLKGTVALSPRGEIEIDARGETSVPGLFAAGDATTVPYKQIIIAAGEGAKAALSAFDYLIRLTPATAAAA